MAAKFELFKDHSGQFHFHLKAENGEIIASSQGYKTKAAAKKGIESVRVTAPGARVVPAMAGGGEVSGGHDFYTPDTATPPNPGSELQHDSERAVLRNPDFLQDTIAGIADVAAGRVRPLDWMLDYAEQ
jgi:uncharacterized protein